MNQAAKWLILAGVILIAAGLIWAFLGRFMNLGKLPGDIKIEKGNFKFYFPIVTCVVISLVLSLISYIVGRFFR